MKLRIVLAMALLAVALSPNWALAQGVGSGGVAGSQAAALSFENQAATFLTLSGRVDHAAAGTGLRNFDSGTIRLRGIPAGSTVVRAFLYWAMLCVSATNCPTGVNIEFEGRTITSTRICTGTNPCWAGGGPIAAYRADVTGLMPGTTAAAVANKVINGDYQVNAIPSNARERDGRDPFAPGTTNFPKAEGATLVVVYSNPALPATGRVYIHNGCDTLTGAGVLNVSNALAPAAPSPLTFVKLTRFGADGQVGVGGASGTIASPTISNETTLFGGPAANCATAALTQIAGDGSLHDRDSDWNGSDGGPLNQLWDTHTTTVTGRLGAAAANYCVRFTSQGDCFTAIGYALSVR